MPFKKSGRKKEDKTYVYRGRRKPRTFHGKKLKSAYDMYEPPETRAREKKAREEVEEYFRQVLDGYEPKLKKNKTTNRTYRRRLYY